MRPSRAVAPGERRLAQRAHPLVRAVSKALFGALRLPCVSPCAQVASQRFSNESEALKRPQITNAFAGANKADRQTGFPSHRQAHARRGRCLPTLVSTHAVRPAALANAHTRPRSRRPKAPAVDDAPHLASSSSKCAGRTGGRATSTMFGARFAWAGPYPSIEHHCGGISAFGAWGWPIHRHVRCALPQTVTCCTRGPRGKGRRRRSDAGNPLLRPPVGPACPGWLVLARPRSRPTKSPDIELTPGPQLWPLR